jgi:PAS domain S-box-containing protein
MADQSKTIQELTAENAALKERIRELEEAEAKGTQTGKVLRANEAGYAALISGISDVVWRYEAGADGTFVDGYISPVADRLLGLSPGTISDSFDTFFSRVYADDLPKVLETLHEGVTGLRQDAVDEYRLCAADGRVLWVRTQGRVVCQSDGHVVLFGTTTDITERKQAEEALRESEARFRFLTAGMKDVLWTVDLDLNITYVSPSVEKVLGFTVEERMKQSVQEQLTPASLQDALDRLADELTFDGEREPGRHMLMELHYYHKNGSIRCLETDLSFIRPELGRPVGIQGMSRDITERKRSEEALKHRLLYEQILSRISTMAVQTEDIDKLLNESLAVMGESLAVSRVYIFEHRHESDTMDNTVEWCSPGESPHKDNLQGLPASAVPFWMASLKEGGTICFADIEDIPDEGAKEILRPQGIRSILAVPLFVSGRYFGFMGLDECRRYREWPDADVEMLLSISRIISGAIERKRAEEALRESEERYQMLFEKSPVGVFTYDSQLRLTECNDRYPSIMKTSRDHLIGLDLAKLLDKKAIPLLRMPLEGLQATFEGLYHATLSDAHIWISANAAPLYDGTGNIVGGMVIVEDITDRKAAEEEREKLHAQLTRAQKLESVGTLAGGIAHDFNNLLMGIQGNASLMMMDLDPSHAHYERLRNVEQHVASGADLTRQLLGFSRGGRYEVKPASMNEIVEKSSVMFGRTKKEISIHRKYSQAPCIVEVDRSQMEQVFMNLFVNAWHAMPGGGDIFIETEQIVLDLSHPLPVRVEPGRYVKVTITDTGAGMDEQTRERIFDPFFTTKEMGRGTGLGLASVYGIIKGHKGMINVYSEPGHGTTFTLYVPASGKDVAEERTTTGDVLRGTETILLVDDEQMVLEVSRDMLKLLGYRVYTAGSGQEAVAVYMEKRGKIDLVILDMIMPGISGSGTFDQLREINPDVKVLLASGYSINGQAQSIIDRGCNGFIQKPFQLKQLSQRVREMLD